MYMQGDLVEYRGTKHRADLATSVGTICAAVQNEEGRYVVDFGSDSYVLAESDLRPFQGRLKQEKEDKKETKVERRRPKRQPRQGSEEESE